MNDTQIELLKSKAKIVNIYPILPIVAEKKKIYLFHSTKEKIEYSLYTDGNTEHIETWTDKNPGARDSFLASCQPTDGYVSRFEFEITEANMILLEKKYQNRMIRELYINEQKLYKVINHQIYQITLNSKENIKVKKMEKLKWR